MKKGDLVQLIDEEDHKHLAQDHGWLWLVQYERKDYSIIHVKSIATGFENGFFASRFKETIS